MLSLFRPADLLLGYKRANLLSPPPPVTLSLDFVFKDGCCCWLLTRKCSQETTCSHAFKWAPVKSTHTNDVEAVALRQHQKMFSLGEDIVSFVRTFRLVTFTQKRTDKIPRPLDLLQLFLLLFCFSVLLLVLLLLYCLAYTLNFCLCVLCP